MVIIPHFLEGLDNKNIQLIELSLLISLSLTTIPGKSFLNLISRRWLSLQKLLSSVSKFIETAISIFKISFGNFSNPETVDCDLSIFKKLFFDN